MPVGRWPLRPVPAVVRGFDPPDVPGAPATAASTCSAPRPAVHAALAGTVSFAGHLAGRGVVVVDHGDTRTTYEPVLPAVRVGQAVAAGAVIGHLHVGGVALLPRACLHWGWLRGETYLDPLLLVGAGPVRLLPLWRDAPVAGPGTPGGRAVRRRAVRRSPGRLGAPRQARGCACW